MEDLLNGLNKEQKEAVIYDGGPLLIIAGAGTGKTTVITRRIAYLIAQKLALPSEILALTFTDKAAVEMEERVDELVPYGFVDTWISTFHAFGDRILRDHALDLGLTTDFRVLSKPEQTIFMQDNLGAFDLRYFSPLGNPMKHIDALLNHFSKLKDEIITPAEYLEYADKKLKASSSSSSSGAKDPEILHSIQNDSVLEAEKMLEIARTYERYQELMAEAGNLDFGDQINMVIRLLKDSPKILEKYQKQFKYILVDEFQDTNYAQNELLKLLASKSGNITVVGDDDQSIYRFRGAAISNILSFAKDYPKCKQIVLTENYRSTQSILDSAYKMIKHNDPDRLEVKNNIVKKLKSKIGAGKNPLIHIHFDTVTSEADKVANIIKEKYESDEYSFKDFAILARSRNSAQAFIHSLDHAGIPYKFSGSAGLYDRPEVRLLIHFARTLTNPGDNLAFYYLLVSEVYNMPVEDAVKLNEISHKTKKSLNHIAKNHANAGQAEKMEISEKSREILDRVCSDTEHFREESRDMTAGQILYLFLKETDYLSRLVTEAENSTEKQVAIQNIAKFFELVGNFEKVSEDKSVINFVHHLGALMDAGDDPATAEVDPDLEAVSILTVHKSKGLEFPVVFLVSLVSDSFPTRKRGEQLPIPEDLIRETLPEGDWHLQEERRLFYVGMTRAKETLYLTSAEDYGGKRARKVSPFVLEAIDVPALAKKKTKLDKIEVIKRFEKTSKVEMPKKFYDGTGMLTLNPHQIDDYLSCPKKFEYIHVLRVPIMTHHSVVYGSAMHKAIESYFVAKKAGKSVTVDDLIEVFHSTWWSEGFITREHEDKRRKQGEKSLREFFSREEAVKNLPDEVESKFEIPMKDLGVKIRGRFDAVYSIRHPERSEGSHLEIRDFKTSEAENQEQADKKAKSNRQLSVYALAKHTETGQIPEVSLYFVDSGLVGKVEKKEKDLDKTREEIEKVAEGIKSENFKAAPGYQECSRCAYREICPFTLSK